MACPSACSSRIVSNDKSTMSHAGVQRVTATPHILCLFHARHVTFSTSRSTSWMPPGRFCRGRSSWWNREGIFFSPSRSNDRLVRPPGAHAKVAITHVRHVLEEHLLISVKIVYFPLRKEHNNRNFSFALHVGVAVKVDQHTRATAQDPLRLRN